MTPRTPRAISVTPLMAHGGLLSFGPYLLDTTTRPLTRDGVEVEIRKRHPVRLTLFTSWSGKVLPNDVLIDTCLARCGGDPTSGRACRRATKIRSLSELPWSASPPSIPENHSDRPFREGESQVMSQPHGPTTAALQWTQRQTVAHTFDRITQNPNVLSGRATIRGLRISVAHVVNLLANDMTPAQIVADLPDLEPDDIRQALGYAAALAQDELHPIRA